MKVKGLFSTIETDDTAGCFKTVHFGEDPVILSRDCTKCKHYSETEHPAECACCQWNPTLSNNFKEA